MNLYALRIITTVAIFLCSNAIRANAAENALAGEHLTMLDIVDMASDFDHDSFEVLATRISDLAGEKTNDGYKVNLKTLSDGTSIASAKVIKKYGKTVDIRIVIGDETCFPVRTAVWRSYAAGPVYSHDNGRYETITPWTKFTFVPRPPGTCLSSLNVERPNERDYESEYMVPINPRAALTAAEMDTLLWLLSGDSDPSIRKIYSIIEHKGAVELGLTLPSALPGNYSITLAKKTKPPGDPFALMIGFSDSPCYPLGRALALTRTRIELGISLDDASVFHSADSDIHTTVYPHSRSPLCLGFIRAYDG